MEYASLKKLPAVVISVDFEKAFDRVEYRALFKIMEWYNFGPNFIQYVRTLFTDFRIVTVNNGYSSQPFKPTWGLFQGNPISSHAFLLIMELLAMQLRADKRIQGIQIGKFHHLLAQFADDLTLFEM